MTRTCSQRSLDTDVVDWLGLAGAAVDCARAPSGERTRAAAAMRATLAKRPLFTVGHDWTPPDRQRAGSWREIREKGKESFRKRKWVGGEGTRETGKTGFGMKVHGASMRR